MCFPVCVSSFLVLLRVSTQVKSHVPATHHAALLKHRGPSSDRLTPLRPLAPTKTPLSCFFGHRDEKNSLNSRTELEQRTSHSPTPLANPPASAS